MPAVGEPSALPLPVGGLNAATHPHLLQSGAAYRYGETVVGGAINLIPDAGRLLTFGDVTVANGQSLPLGGTGFYNQLDVNVNQRVMNILSENISRYLVWSNGEFCWTATTTSEYGAMGEAFSTAGSMAVNNGSTSVTGSGGSNFLTATLPGYAYVPSKNAPKPGDVLVVGAAGTRNYYRISAIASDSAMTIFPAYQQSNFAASANYRILRTGYGSISHVVRIPHPDTGDSYCYYAGNMRTLVHLPGAIECVVVSGASYTVTAHFTGPQTATGATDVKANDVTYYKSFLLYGYGSTIGWSVAGFPTSFTTGFGATDFPANNISVVANNDTFAGFEYIGDQLIALFRDSVWLVQATGSVPEFTFYRLPDIIGAVTQGQVDGQVGGTFSYCRASISGRGAAYYVSRQGVMELSGGIATLISEAVHPIGLSGGPWVLSCLDWDKYSDTLIWYAGGTGGLGIGLCYRVPYKAWFQVHLGTNARAMAGGISPASGYFNDPIRVFGIGYWDSANAVLNCGTTSAAGRAYDLLHDESPPLPWAWLSPIGDMGAGYGTFQFGGFTIDAFGKFANLPSLDWTIYGGKTPYNMTSRDTGTASYAKGIGARDKLGGKIDDRYIGVKLSGSGFIDLAGVWIYPAAADRARR